MKKLHIGVILGVFFATCGSLFVAYQLWWAHGVRAPLESRLSSIITPGAWHWEGRGADILNIEIVREADFPAVAARVMDELGMAPRDITPLFKDNPNTELNSLRRSLDLAFWEARYHHSYLALEQQVAEAAGALEVCWQLGVDERNIYLSLSGGDHYLQEVLPLAEVRDAK